MPSSRSTVPAAFARVLPWKALQPGPRGAATLPPHREMAKFRGRMAISWMISVTDGSPFPPKLVSSPGRMWLLMGQRTSVS